jgi:hypothetical protein
MVIRNRIHWILCDERFPSGNGDREPDYSGYLRLSEADRQNCDPVGHSNPQPGLFWKKNGFIVIKKVERKG